MNFKQADIAKFLKNPDPSIKCVVIFGTSEGRIADLSKSFGTAVCPDLTDAFRVSSLEMSAVEKDPGLLFGEYNAQSFLGGRRVVFLKDADNNLTDILKNLFKENESDTLLIVTSTSLNKKSSLVTLATNDPSFALISCYEDREEDISSFVSAFLRQNGITIPSQVFPLLCARLSPDRKISEGELEKLLTYLGSRRNIELADIQTVISDSAGTSLEDFTFYAADGEAAKALNAYRQLLNEGTEPVSLVRILSNHFLRLLDCAEKLESGQTAFALCKAQRPPIVFYREDSFIRQMKTWKKTAVLDVLDLLYRAERDCKTTNMPADKILSYTIMQIASAVRRFRR